MGGEAGLGGKLFVVGASVCMSGWERGISAGRRVELKPYGIEFAGFA